VTFGGSLGRSVRALPQAPGAHGSAVAILMSRDYLKAEKQEKFEYAILILLSTTGMLMLISAADLIAMYLGLELMSLAPMCSRPSTAIPRARPKPGSNISSSARCPPACCSMAPR
jgi:hypothetical protein